MRLNPASLTSSEKQELLALLEERARRKSQNKLASYYPDDGPLRRELSGNGQHPIEGRRGCAAEFLHQCRF